jgi:hypothetical protein
LKATSEVITSRITSISANDDNIFCLTKTSRTTNSPKLFIYNWSLDLVRNIGQENNFYLPFYIPIKSQIDVIDEFYVFKFNNDLNVMEASSGQVIKSFTVAPSSPASDKFWINSNKHIAIMSDETKSLIFYDLQGRVITENEIKKFPNYGMSLIMDKHDNIYFYDKSSLFLFNN